MLSLLESKTPREGGVQTVPFEQLFCFESEADGYESNFRGVSTRHLLL